MSFVTSWFKFFLDSVRQFSPHVAWSGETSRFLVGLPRRIPMKRLIYVWFVCAMPVAAAASAAPMYRLTDLGTLGGPESRAYGINNSGQIVGIADINVTTSQACLYSGGTMTDLGTFVGPNSFANAINDSGQVVGRAGNGHAFLYSNGTVTDLGSPGPSPSGRYGYDVNNSGQIVGVDITSSGLSGTFRAFLYSGGNMEFLPIAPDSQAYAINNSGQIVGYYSIGGRHHAFQYSDGMMTDLGTLGGNNSYALDINDRGQIIGYSDTSDGKSHAFLYTDGMMTDLSVLMGTDSGSAIGINNRGDVLGSSALGPFLYSDGTMYTLNTLVDFPGPGWRLYILEDINDSGWIVGRGIYDPDGVGGIRGVERAILLTPVVPETSTLALTVVGVLVLVARQAWRKSKRQTRLFANRIV